MRGATATRREMEESDAKEWEEQLTWRTKRSDDAIELGYTRQREERGRQKTEIALLSPSCTLRLQYIGLQRLRPAYFGDLLVIDRKWGKLSAWSSMIGARRGTAAARKREAPMASCWLTSDTRQARVSASARVYHHNLALRLKMLYSGMTAQGPRCQVTTFIPERLH